MIISELDRMIEAARAHVMTKAERDAQVRSFAYGNTHLENPSITRADVDKAVDTLEGDHESQPQEAVKQESTRLGEAQTESSEDERRSET